MGDRTVVYREDADSDAAESVSARLKASGVDIVETQPDMLLVEGTRQTISDVVNDIKGWSASAETLTPLPDTREQVTKPQHDAD